MIGPLSRWWANARVEVYTVHEPPHPPADRIDRAERIVLQRDGFSWAALIFGPLWLMFKGQWLGLVLYLGVAVAGSLLLTSLGANEGWAGLFSLALNLFLGFEASSLLRWSMERRGFTEIGTVSGRSYSDCERRFFEGWLMNQPAISALAQGLSDQAAAVTGAGPSAEAARSGWRRWYSPGRPAAG